MDTIQLTFSSKLAASAEQCWSWATSVSGISAEMRPLLKMTMPKGMQHLLDYDVTLGQPLFRSWILLFGVLPIDRTDLTLIELEQGHRFLEQSPMLSMSLWRHERVINGTPEGAILTDKLEFAPYFAARIVRWFVKRVFEHRHAVLRRALGSFRHDSALV